MDHLIVSDEAVFSLNSEINTRKVRKYALHSDGHPPDHYVEFHQGANQVMMWACGLGPHLVQGNTLTLESICESSAITLSREIFVFMVSMRVPSGGNTLWLLRTPAMRRCDTIVGNFPAVLKVNMVTGHAPLVPRILQCVTFSFGDI